MADLPVEVEMRIGPRTAGVLGFLLGSVMLMGCRGMDTGSRESIEEPIVVVPGYTEFLPGDEVGREGVETPEEFVREAEVEARRRGWRLPVQCTFILRDEGAGVTQVVVDPLTPENLRSSGVRLDCVEWGLLRER